MWNVQNQNRGLVASKQFTCAINISTTTDEELRHLLSLSHVDLIRAFQRILEARAGTVDGLVTFDGVKINLNETLKSLTGGEGA